MAVRAYVLLTCAPGETHRVVDALRQLPGVATADAVVGTYDAIMAVRAGSMATLLELITERIGLLPGVLSTATHVVVEHDRHAPGGDMPRRRP